MSKIIEFPKDRIKTVPANIGEGIDQLYVKKKGFVDSLVHNYATILFHKLSLHGFDTSGENFIYDYAFTIESLRSALYRDLGIDHPFQEISNSTRDQFNSELSIDNYNDEDIDIEDEFDEDQDDS